MKKIINGKMYNTETAKYLAAWWNGLGCNDFGYVYEDLYKKKTGEFFLHGRGGANSKYAERYGRCFSDGEAITPLTEEEAREWAEKKLEVEEYIEIFGEPEE